MKPVAIVTGGSRGIGRAISYSLIDYCSGIAICYRKRTKDAMAAVRVIKRHGVCGLAIKMDVTQRKEIKKAFKVVLSEFGRIDFLINCAGISLNKDFMRISEKEWDYVNAVNTKAIYLTAQEVVPTMKTQGGGRIINIASVSGIRPTGKEKVAYCTSKAGCIMLTKSLALALAPYNITVNAIAPGIISTELTAKRLKSPTWRKDRIAKIPLRRVGLPQDIDAAVQYFLSASSSWTTGAVLVVDGGQMVF